MATTAATTNGSSACFLKADLGGNYYRLGPVPQAVDAENLTLSAFNDSQFLGGFGGLGAACGNGKKFLISLTGDYVLNALNNIDYYNAPQTSSVPGGGDIDLSQYPDKSRLRGLGLSLAPEWFLSEKNKNTRLGVIASVLFPDAKSNTPLKDLSGSQDPRLVVGIGPILEHDVVSGRLGALALVLDGQVGGLWDDQNQFYGPAWKVGAGLSGRIGVLGGQNIWVDGDGDGQGKKGSDPRKTYGAVPKGWVTNDGDCDDLRPDLAANCPSVLQKAEPALQVFVTEEKPGIFYPDVDQDKYGDQSKPESVTPTEAKELGLIAQGGDCDDSDNAIHEGCQTVIKTNVQVTNIRQELTDLARDIQFEQDSDVLLPQSKVKLDKVAKILAENLELTNVAIDGHTSSEGTSEHNLDLSQKRAAAVVAYLVIRQGIAANRLNARGFGETKPLSDDQNGTNEIARVQNRRVEITILEAEQK